MSKSKVEDQEEKDGDLKDVSLSDEAPPSNEDNKVNQHTKDEVVEYARTVSGETYECCIIL